MNADFKTIINDGKTVIVDFHAEWCSPCKVQGPILEELASEVDDNVKIIKIDVDRNRELATQYNIQGVPTIMIFKDGQIKHKQAGVHSKKQLIDLLTTHK